MSFDLSKLAEQAMQMQKEAQRLQEEAAAKR
jgi:DNA-binding protein YbaB